MRVVLLSGGMDSTLAFMMSHREDPTTRGLWVDLGQPYSKKEKSVIQFLKKRYSSSIFELSCLVVNEQNGNVPTIDNQVIDGRNLTLACLAANYGDEIWLCALDGEMHEYMPDKNKAFFDTATIALTQAYGRSVRVKTPFVDLTKAELIALALKKGITKEEILSTSTCYHPSIKKCGKCSACVKRWIALKLNKISERTEKSPLDSEYAKFYKAAVQDAWNRQDFKHYNKKRIIEAYQAFELSDMSIK